MTVHSRLIQDHAMGAELTLAQAPVLLRSQPTLGTCSTVRSKTAERSKISEFPMSRKTYSVLPFCSSLYDILLLHLQPALRRW